MGVWRRWRVRAWLCVWRGRCMPDPFHCVRIASAGALAWYNTGDSHPLLLATTITATRRLRSRDGPFNRSAAAGSGRGHLRPQRGPRQHRDRGAPTPAPTTARPTPAPTTTQPTPRPTCGGREHPPPARRFKLVRHGGAERQLGGEAGAAEGVDGLDGDCIDGHRHRQAHPCAQERGVRRCIPVLRAGEFGIPTICLRPASLRMLQASSPS